MRVWEVFASRNVREKRDARKARIHCIKLSSAEHHLLTSLTRCTVIHKLLSGEHHI